MFLVKLHSNEEIASQNLNSFILTNLKKKNINLSTKDKLFVSFIKELSLYQLFIIKDKTPEVFFYKPNEELELLVSKEFFVLFKAYKVYYYEKCNNLELKDIYLYLEKSFQIKNIKTSFYDDIILNKEHLYEFIQPLKPKLFKLFTIYILILALGFYFFENQNKSENFSDFTKELKSSKTQLEYNYLKNDIKRIKKAAKDFEIELITLEYSEGNFFLIFSSLNNKKLEEFLKKFSTYKLEKIENNKTTNRLICHAYIKLNRK